MHAFPERHCACSVEHTLTMTSGLLTHIGTLDTQMRSTRKYRTVVCELQRRNVCDCVRLSSACHTLLYNHDAAFSFTYTPVQIEILTGPSFTGTVPLQELAEIPVDQRGSYHKELSTPQAKVEIEKNE